MTVNNIIYNKHNKEIFEKLIMKREVHLFIDGANLFAINFFKNKDLTNKHGEVTGGLFGFIRAFMKMMDMFYPDIDNVHVVWDKGRSARALSLDPEYKANRDKIAKKHEELDPEKAEKEKKEFSTNRQKTREFIESIGVKQYLIDNVEGDIILSYLIMRFLKNKPKNSICVIISNDSDFFQLLQHYPDVIIWSPIKKVFITPDLISEIYLKKKVDYKITPLKFLLSKCLSGDTSDNIKGIDGIGKVRAFNFIKSIPNDVITIDDLIKSIEEKPIKNNYEKLVLNHEHRLRTNFELINLMEPEKYITTPIKAMINDVLEGETRQDFTKSYQLLSWCECGTIIQKFPIFIQQYGKMKIEEIFELNIQLSK